MFSVAQAMQQPTSSGQGAEGGGKRAFRQQPACTHDELICIHKLQHTVYGVEDFPEGRLLRWLRAYDGDYDKCQQALYNHIIFRKAWNLDELTTAWKMPQVLDKFCGYGFCGPDNEGCPVMVSPFGNQDVEGIFKSCQSQEYIKFCLMIIERGMQKCEQLAHETDHPYEQMSIVFDLDHMTLDMLNCKPFAATFLTVIALYQEHYPNLLKKILLINAPTMAQYVYKLLTPFLSADTKQLIEMPGDDWLQVIAGLMPLRNWPAVLGGELAEPEDLHHFNELTVNDELRIPDSYYVDWSNQHEDFQEEVTVYPRNKHVIELDVETPGSELIWTYATIEEDIGFAVYHDWRGNSKSVDRMVPVYPSIRLECSVVPVTGSIVCDRPGRYIIEFDNSYSWFSAKELRYSVDLIEPEVEGIN